MQIGFCVKRTKVNVGKEEVLRAANSALRSGGLLLLAEILLETCPNIQSFITSP